MGEIAEMILVGILCEQCGIFINDGVIPGHPRTCESCKDWKVFMDGLDIKGLAKYIQHHLHNYLPGFYFGVDDVEEVIKKYIVEGNR